MQLYITTMHLSNTYIRGNNDSYKSLLFSFVFIVLFFTYIGGYVPKLDHYKNFIIGLKNF